MPSPSPRRFERASRFWLAAFQNLNIGVGIEIDDVLGGDLQNESATRRVFCQIGLPKEWISNCTEAPQSSSAKKNRLAQVAKQSQSLGRSQSDIRLAT